MADMPEPKGKTIVAAEEIVPVTRMSVEYSGEVPCLWERGGGMTTTGKAVVVAGPEGDPKPAEYVRRRGSLSNADHARIPVAPGDLVVTTEHHRGDCDTRVYRIAEIALGQARATLIHRFVLGRWDTEPTPGILNAVRAAEGKSRCYHCREPFYIEKEVI